MNLAKLIAFLRGDPIENWLEGLDYKVKSRPLSRGMMELVYILVIIALMIWAVEGFWPFLR